MHKEERTTEYANKITKAIDLDDLMRTGIN